MPEQALKEMNHSGKQKQEGRKSHLASEAGWEMLKFIGRLLLATIAVFILLYCGYNLIEDASMLIDHRERGDLFGIQYFAKRPSNLGCQLPEGWDDEQAAAGYYEQCGRGRCCYRLQGPYVLKLYAVMSLYAIAIVSCVLLVVRFTCNYCFSVFTCRSCRRVWKKGRKAKWGDEDGKSAMQGADRIQNSGRLYPRIDDRVSYTRAWLDYEGPRDSVSCDEP